MSPSPYVPKSVCQSLCPPVPMFPSLFASPYAPQSLCSQVCFPVLMSPSPYVPKSVCQSLCPPVPMFPSLFASPYVPQSLCSRVFILLKDVSQLQCSPIIFSSPVAPQTYIQYISGKHVVWQHSELRPSPGIIGTSEHGDCNKGTGEYWWLSARLQ